MRASFVTSIFRNTFQWLLLLLHPHPIFMLLLLFFLHIFYKFFFSLLIFMFLFYTFINIFLLRFEEMLNICESYYPENFGEPFLYSYEVLQVKCTGAF